MSKSHMGQPSGNKGKILNEEARMKLSELNKGKNHPRYKSIDLEKLKKLRSDGKSIKDLSLIFNISISTVTIKLKEI